jgi:CheY-like chemotaxis protein
MAHILVVDDEELVRNLLGTVLRRLGHSVAFASSGEEAVAAFRLEQPHVAILDLRLPGMDGIAVLEQVRSTNTDVPIIFLTGLGAEEDERRARSLGVTAFLKKEFSLHKLSEALRVALKESGRRPPITRPTAPFLGIRN